MNVYKIQSEIDPKTILMKTNDHNMENCEASFPTPHVLLTIGECVEDSHGAEAAIAGFSVHPHLDLVGRGPAQVRQHRLVRFTLRVVALVFTAALLRRTNTRVSCSSRSGELNQESFSF